MAYTQARFELAKELFLPASTPNSGLTEYFNKLNESKWYSLRKRYPNGAQTQSTWIDQDDTSDYDPKERRLQKRKRPPRVDDSGNRPAKRVVKAFGRLVKLNIKSDEAKGMLGTLFPTEGNLKLQRHESDIDEWKEYWEAVPEILDGELGTPYALRTRERHSDSRPCKSVLSLDLGNPAAGGCRSCWEFGHDCLLLDRPLVYPCQVCREDRLDCELFIEPKRKRSCENCKRRRKRCSYSHSKTDHEQPCKRCQVLGIHCLAGPAKYQPGAEEAEQANGQVEEQAKDQHGEASGPDTEGKDEVRQGLPSVKPRFNEIVQPRPAPSEVREENPRMTEGFIRTIKTSFAHPIDFAYQPPEDGSAPCNWCDNFAYGFIGLGSKTVDVIDYGDGQYIEMGRGHSESHPPSRMCIACALERVHIMRCAGHRIVPLKGYDVNTFDFEAAYCTLVPVPDQPPTMSNPWCSLCPNPAFHGCGTIQTRNKYQEAVTASSIEAKRCGLLLCEQCAALMEECNGNLDEVAGRNRQEDAEFGSRADVDYVLPGNQLYRLYCGE